MKRFAQLYQALDLTTSTNAKVDALAEYFRTAPAADAAWVVFFLSGKRFKRPVSTTVMRRWTYEITDTPEWLFEMSYSHVGDLAETISLFLDAAFPEVEDDEFPLHRWVEERLLTLRDLDEGEQHEKITGWWKRLPRDQVMLLNKLFTGGMRVGVSKRLVVRALARVAELPRPVISHRMMGDWEPSAEFFEDLLSEETRDADTSRPYPYFLASPLERQPAELGPPGDWMVEWKWDGIRSQLIKRGGEIFLWSRGQELITKRFPEISEAAERLPGGVALDGELLAWDAEAQKPLPFSELQKRIGRKRVPQTLIDEVPVVFQGYDIMEFGDVDIRQRSIAQRRKLLEKTLRDTHERLRLSTIVTADSWEAYASLRQQARDRGVEGLMLKRMSSPYRTGRKRGDWWKWKVEPYTIDAILLYAQAGHGKRAGLHTDYTFAVPRHGMDDLVPIAKAYSGLSNDDIRELDAWIRDNTVERFGPVRSVPPHHVFEIAFEGIAPSNRHKSGIAVRFPRITRWRRDKSPAEANSLDDVRDILEAHRA
ncbi:MAG: ATP-dependent DNA ligase [Myxococcota bacterium]